MPISVISSYKIVTYRCSSILAVLRISFIFPRNPPCLFIRQFGHSILLRINNFGIGESFIEHRKE